ncbi:MAG TPA: RidA family protein [Ruminiclostridium sp.]|nr:RidA family protein [Ruminiclostridium sp.]
MNVNDRMKELCINIPNPPPLGGIYSPAVEFNNNLVYSSGCGPQVDGKPLYLGKMGSELVLEQGQQAGVACMKNVLSVVRQRIGDLDRIKRVVKILAFVSSDNNFYDQPAVINPASQLLIDIFGEEAGKAARSAIGVNVLPGNIPVEIEVLFELK